MIIINIAETSVIDTAMVRPGGRGAQGSGTGTGTGTGGTTSRGSKKPKTVFVPPPPPPLPPTPPTVKPPSPTIPPSPITVKKPSRVSVFQAAPSDPSVNMGLSVIPTASAEPEPISLPSIYGAQYVPGSVPVPFTPMVVESATQIREPIPITMPLEEEPQILLPTFDCPAHVQIIALDSGIIAYDGVANCDTIRRYTEDPGYTVVYKEVVPVEETVGYWVTKPSGVVEYIMVLPSHIPQLESIGWVFSLTEPGVEPVEEVPFQEVDPETIRLAEEYEEMEQKLFAMETEEERLIRLAKQVEQSVWYWVTKPSGVVERMKVLPSHISQLEGIGWVFSLTEPVVEPGVTVLPPEVITKVPGIPGKFNTNILVGLIAGGVLVAPILDDLLKTKKKRR